MNNTNDPIKDDHINLIQKYFDKNAQSWHDYYTENAGTVGLVISERLAIGLDMITQQLEPGAKIVDAGCGAGWATIQLAARGYIVHGIDISDEMIALCEKNRQEDNADVANISFSVGDILKMDIPENSLDGILALGFIQYQSEEIQALEHLRRLLKDDGVLVLSGPVKRQLTNYFGFSERIRGMRTKLRGKKKNNLLHAISVNSYSIGRFRKILKKSGFQIASWRGHGYVHFQFIGPRLGQVRQIRLHKFFTALARVFPIQAFANDMVVAAVKKTTG